MKNINLELTSYTSGFGMEIFYQESLKEKDCNSTGEIKFDRLVIGYDKTNISNDSFIGIVICKKSGVFSDYADGSECVEVKTCVCDTLEDAKNKIIQMCNDTIRIYQTYRRKTHD